MGREIIRQKSPEEELEAKQKVLSELEENGILQLELSTLESRTQVFNAMYLNRLAKSSYWMN